MNLPQNQLIDVSIFKRLVRENLSTSYKLFWLSGIYKEIIQGVQVISFRKIVCRMIIAAWFPLVEYHLNFGFSDQLYNVVMLIYHRYKFASNVEEKELLLFFDDLKDVEIEKRMAELYKYVPYRLLAPFFSSQLVRIEDYKKNRIITELSQLSNNALYKIDSVNKMITINKNWFDYIYNNQVIVNGWLSFELAHYLQKRNPNVPAIIFKLNAQCRESLGNATKFWNEINNISKLNDIYTGKELIKENFNTYGELSIDHFIPWSFVLHDEMWNLIPTFKNINSSKNNKLPQLDLYIDKFCNIQYNAFNIMKSNNAFKHCIEDYLTINKKIDINLSLHKDITKEEFTDSIKSVIIPLFQIASNQGYGLWHNHIS